MSRVSAFVVLLALQLVLAAPMRGDDWPQFRHDATRSAVSTDRLRFPLKELWTWNTMGPGGHRPLYHAVIWHEQVYFTASEKDRRYLICADAKTGVVRWRQPLEAERLDFCISDIAGPAVNEMGRVFVYDWISLTTFNSPLGRAAAETLFGQGISQVCTMIPDLVGCFAVRTFNAMTGKEGPYFPMAAMGATGVLPRLSLTDTWAGQEVAEVPPTMAGCPP